MLAQEVTEHQFRFVAPVEVGVIKAGVPRLQGRLDGPIGNPPLRVINWRGFPGATDAHAAIHQVGYQGGMGIQVDLKHGMRHGSLRTQTRISPALRLPHTA